MNDIDLSSVCSEEEGVSWTPIGNSYNNAYTGTFNGDGHTISGLYIDSSDNDYKGLFGYLSTDGYNTGTVQNLSVSGSVKGNRYVGGVVGRNGGRITDCAFSGSVSGKISVGGVVGGNSGSNGVVENCYNTGTVTGTRTDDYLGGVGGVVGYNSGTVKNCYNTGKVTGSADSSDVGGVVGWNGSGSVENCYNTGSVTSSGNYVGGVAGYNSGTVENCYNTGTVSDGITSGGVVGQNSGSVTNCYFLTGTAKKGIGGGEEIGATGLTADQFKKQENFADWDFDIADTDTWSIHPVLGRPVLNENREGGLGTDKSPYEISTADQLENFRDLVNDENDQTADTNAHAKLMNNIDLSSVCSAKEGSWTPIGNSIGKSYEGTFNGAGHTISGLYIKNTSNDTDYQGLFGFVGSEGTVQNLTVDGTVSGSWSVGGVVGYNNGGTVTGCTFSVSGTVSGRMYVGGVVGRNSGTYGSVTNCYNTGEVTGSTSGGVVGYNQSGTVENCYNTGTVSGSDYVGGVVGSNSGSVTNCYNTGSGNSVGGNSVGGVVGYNSSASVANCYYQTGKGAAVGIGGTTGDNSSQTAAKSLEDFHSGEVAYLLEKGVTDEKPVWGQDLTDKNSLPTLVALDKANAQKVYRLTFNWNMGDQQPDTVRYTNGSVTLPADNEIPTRTGYHISGWKDKNGKPVTAETTVEEDAVFTAEWTANTYTITVTAGSGGTVSGGGNVTHGDSVEVTATANQGYHFVNWTENGTEVSTSATYSFTATANRTLTANFAADAVEPDPEPTPEPEPEEPPYSGKYSYEISTDIGDNGAISVDRYATEGDKVTITVSPDEAYLLDDLSVTAGGKDVALTANSDGTYTFTMPSADVKITATFAEDPDWTPDEPEEPTTDVSDLFIDIAPDAWYKDAIQYAYDNGLMTGVSATEFAPEQTTTRAMIVSILARLENVTTAEAAGFADVDDEWYATAVNWAANVGVVNGYEDNTFKPNTAITREQLAAILMNYAAYKGYDVSARADLSHYSDADSISSWANDVLLWAVAEGLLTGVTDDTIAPQAHATRAQVAAILQRFLSE